MKSLIGILTFVAFFFTLLIPKAAYSSPWSLMEDVPQTKGKIMSLKQGDKVPFSGILFDTEAAVRIQVDKEMETERCKIQIDREVGLVKAELELKLANEKAGREAAAARVTELKSIKDDQIKFLSNELIRNEKKNKRDLAPMWVSVGVISGVILTVLSAVALNQAGKI